MYVYIYIYIHTCVYNINLVVRTNPKVYQLGVDRSHFSIQPRPETQGAREFLHRLHDVFRGIEVHVGIALGSSGGTENVVQRKGAP